MVDLINDYDYIFEYEDGLLGLKAEGDLDTTWVGQNFVVADVEETFSILISDIINSSLSMEDVAFSPAALIPDGAADNNQRRIVDPFEFTNVFGKVLSEQNVLSVDIATGAARLTFTNKLPIDFLLTEIRLVNLLNSQLIVVHSAPVTIRAGATERIDLDITGKQLTNFSHWRISGSSPGSRGAEVSIDSDDCLELSVDLINFKLKSITAKSDGFQVEQCDSVIIGEAVCIRDATFKKGVITFDIENHLAMDLEIDIQSAQFTHRITRQPLHIHTIVPKNSVAHEQAALQSYEIAYAGALRSPQCVHFVAHANGVKANEEVVTLVGKETIQFTFGMRDAVIDEFTGRLNDYLVGMRPITQTVELPENLQSFHGLNLTDARLSFDFYNTIEMPIHLDGVMTGFAHDGKKASLAISGDLAPGQPGKEVVTRLTFDSADNPDVLALVSLPPQRVQFSGTTLVGHGLEEGSITSKNYLRAHYVLETPAHLAWKETEFEPDTTYFQINPKAYDGPQLRKNVIQLAAKDVNQLQAFQLMTNIENHMPVSGAIEFRLRQDVSQSTESMVWLSPVEVESATIDVQGRTEESWEERSEITLNTEDLSIFRNDSDAPKLLTLVTTLKMNGTNNQRVKVYDSDYLIVRSAARFIIGVNQN
ncbi:hypothetical protein JXA02_12420 [candidate division KSB1 bacterium]|nr:hypothetical protein [candidate division KSB1 bacterium]